MAHLWLRDREEDQWALFHLAGDGVVLSPGLPRPAPMHENGGKMQGDVVLLPALGSSGANWVLVTGAGTAVGVNGIALQAGIRVLADRDEIHITGRASYYFSTETLATVEVFVGADRRLLCPRCQDEIATGEMSVKCPQCRLVYHQSETLPCWTYAETCAACSQSTDLKSGYRWTPDAI